MKVLCLIPLFFLYATLRAAAPDLPATLPITETPVASLALLVVPNTLVVSPDSSRVALIAQGRRSHPRRARHFCSRRR